MAHNPVARRAWLAERRLPPREVLAATRWAVDFTFSIRPTLRRPPENRAQTPRTLARRCHHHRLQLRAGSRRRRGGRGGRRSWKWRRVVGWQPRLPAGSVPLTPAERPALRVWPRAVEPRAPVAWIRAVERRAPSVANRDAGSRDAFSEPDGVLASPWLLGVADAASPSARVEAIGLP